MFDYKGAEDRGPRPRNRDAVSLTLESLLFDQGGLRRRLNMLSDDWYRWFSYGVGRISVVELL